MAFFKSLLWNANYLIRQPFTNSKPVTNQEVGLTQINYAGFQDPKDKEAVYPNWFFSARLGQPRDINVRTIRSLSKSSWVQMVIRTFKMQIMTIPWQIVKEDEEDETDRSEDIKIVTEFMKNINDNNQTVVDINSEAITDLAEIDSACFNYVYSVDSYEIGQVPVYNAKGGIESYEEGLKLKPLGQRKLVKIKSADGATMLKQVDLYKNLLNYWQYSFKNPRENPTRFERDEINYMMLNSKSYDVYGFSPVQSIQQVIELLIQGTRYNKDLYTNNAIPDFLISLPKIPLPTLKELKRRWNNGFKGRPHQIGFVNWVMDKIQKLNDTNRDLEWLDGQKWYFKIVFGAFGVSPTEAGFFENSNKSNDDGQERVTVRNALKPYMAELEKAHKRTINEILQRTDHGLCFKFLPRDHTAEKVEFEQDMKELEVGALTINEYRNKKGLEPVEWGNEPLRRPFNPADGFSNFGGLPNQQGKENMEPNDNKSDDAEKSNTDMTLKKKDIEPGEEVIEEAEDYSDFLYKTFDGFEKKVINAVDKIKFEKGFDKEVLTKTFGDFLRDLFNVVNTKLFASRVKRYLKGDLISGMLSAESETGMDIGFTKAYEDKLNQLQGQQINGYTINGKLWPGIKGVTKEMQSKVIKTVQDGISKEKTIQEIKDDIKKTFGSFTDFRSSMIARTETNRILNEGKVLGYKETKIKGKKVWSAAIDNRTSDICKRLNGQERDLDEPFIDQETNKSFNIPPAHPACRSVIYFKPI